MKFQRISMAVLYCVLMAATQMFTGCKDENGSPIIFSLTPQQPTTNAAIGDKTAFHIDVRSDEPLHRFYISQQDFKYGLLVLLDSSLSTSRFVYDFVFETPVIPDSAIITLTFRATDIDQHDVSLVRKIRVLGDNVLLEESTGHVLFSSLSGGYSAFNLNMVQPLSAEDNPDSLLHFADHSVDSVHFNDLSRKWISPAGYRFVRFEGFSYPEATRSKLQNAYDSGIKLSSVNNIVNDDVILVGYNEKAVAVIYVVQVIDQDSTLNDKYLFNLKKESVD